MGWIAELFSGYVAEPNDEQHQAFNRELARLRSARNLSHSVDDHVTLLEDDLARTLLLLHSLTEALVRKGAVSREDIETAGREIDLRDGKADGKLDPAMLRPADKPAREIDPDISPEEYLHQLEQELGS